MFRKVSSGYKAPIFIENLLLYKLPVRAKHFIEVPDNDVDKESCTPIIIERWNYDAIAPSPSYFSVFWVDFNKNNIGPTVLDLLTHIKDNLDSSLSFKSSCGQGLCGICGVNINGKNCLSCTAPTTPGKQMTIAAMTASIPTRDLVCEQSSFLQALKKSEPWLKTSKNNSAPQSENLQTPSQRAKYEPALDCNLCTCCNQSCPTYWWSKNFVYGPAILTQIYRWLSDSRDEGRKSRLKDLSKNLQASSCNMVGACKSSCPLGINPKAMIESLQSQVRDFEAEIKDWE